VVGAEAQMNGNRPIGGMWAKGTVRAGDAISLYAPMGGQLEAFDWSIGDDIGQGEVLMRVRPREVNAPYDGVIRAQHAQINDLAANVAREYGALMYLERQDVQRLVTSTSTAYDDAENRDIRVGEALRVYNNKSNAKDKRESLGRVVSVSGSNYVVEFPSGIFDVEESVSVYRGSGKEYKDKDKVGKGKVSRVPPISILADGLIADILVQEGQTVRRGQPLYALDAADARHESAALREVSAPEAGVLTMLYVQAGQHVQKGQLLMTVTPLNNLECVVDVDELDVLSLSLGGTLLVKLDAQPNELLAARIERIAPMGKIMLDTTKYEVTLTFIADADYLLPGMHVTAYWD